MKIKNCTITFNCPKHWEHLDLTDDAFVRTCQICDRGVYHAKNDEQALKFAKEGKCIAVGRSGNVYITGSVAPGDELKYSGVKVAVLEQHLNDSQFEIIRSIVSPNDTEFCTKERFLSKPINVAFCKNPKEQQAICEKLVLANIKHKIFKW